MKATRKRKTTAQVSKEEKEQRDQRYRQLYTIIEEFGEWEVNCLQLSKKWAIPTSTLNRWKQSIVKEIGPVDISKVGKNIDFTMTANLKLLQREIRKCKDPRIKARLIGTFNHTVKTYCEFAERFGYKSIVPKRFEVDNKSPWWEQVAEEVEKLTERST